MAGCPSQWTAVWMFLTLQATSQASGPGPYTARHCHLSKKRNRFRILSILPRVWSLLIFEESHPEITTVGINHVVSQSTQACIQHTNPSILNRLRHSGVNVDALLAVQSVNKRKDGCLSKASRPMKCLSHTAAGSFIIMKDTFFGCGILFSYPSCYAECRLLMLAEKTHSQFNCFF